jgi:MFS superfamily sulfate permease-like transporter
MNVYEACLMAGCLFVIFGLLRLAAMKIRDEEE